MNLRSVTLGAGAAVSTFLLAGAATVELLGAGEAPGLGIVGVFVGLLAGLLAGGLVAVGADRLSGLAAAGLAGYATFGVAIVMIAALQYVNVLGADDVFTFPVHLAASVAIAVIVALLTARAEFQDSPEMLPDR